MAAVRAFNRLDTNMIGLLRGKYLDTPYSLTEARILFELAQRDASEVTDLRRTLDIDAGYLSRILARFSSGGLVTPAALVGRRAPPGHHANGKRALRWWRAWTPGRPRRPGTCWPRCTTMTGAGCWTPCT